MEDANRFKDVDTKKLGVMVRERLWLATRIARLVQSAVSKYGKEVLRKEYKFHVNGEDELKGFANFDFYCSYGMTEMGGNRVAVSYNSQPVFAIYYQANLKEDLKIEHFDEQTPWLKKFEQAMRKRKAIIARMKLKKQVTEKKNFNAAAEEKRRAALLIKAKELGL